jgi:ATPases of the AAA+ class
MSTFQKGEKIGKFEISYFIKKGFCAESYAVHDESGKKCFLKIFDMDRVPASQLFENKEVYEIMLSHELKNDCVISFVASGELQKNAKMFHYLVTEFYEGQTLMDAVTKDGPFEPESAADIMSCVLSGLDYIHSKALIHNDITPSNVILHELKDGLLQPVIIDLGHISYMVMGRPPFFVDDLLPFFRAPETFKGIYTPKSDIFSAGALFYFLIFGKAPWESDLTACNGEKTKVKYAVKEARKAELSFELPEDAVLPDWVKSVLQKALSKKADERFSSANEFFMALQNKTMPAESEQTESEIQPLNEGQQTNANQVEFEIMFKKGSGNGFDNVAGREELKESLRKEVLFPLQNEEKAKKYQLEPVNGILLYGPPGCGKSMVAESFADEMGFDYSFIEASKFGNIYSPGVLDMIKTLFDLAAEKAPSLLCFDGLEYLVPNRNPAAYSLSREVSIFTSILNNCSQRRILFVATSNRPDMIDPAVIKVGCLDKAFIVTQPDFEARKDIFKKHLEGRPCDTLDFDELAKLSDNFVAGDITETINDAATTAAYMDVPISQTILRDVLKYKNPSYSIKSKIGYHKS